VGGAECDSSQTPSCTRAAPREHKQPVSAANRAGKQGAARQSVQAGHAGKARGQGAVPLLATQLVDIALPGDIVAMVSTHRKTVARKSVGT